MRDPLPTDHYRTLGLSPNASHTEVKARYRLLSKQYHPDKGGDQAAMAQLNLAYSVLSNTFKRNIYDAERQRTVQSPKMQPVRRPPVHTTMPRSRPYARRPSWWPKLAWGFAGLVILLGILFNLPIAEAMTPEPRTQTTSKPLDITYPSDPPAQSSSIASSPQPTPPTQTQPQASEQTNKSPEQRCTTKAFGPYQRTICRSEDGTKVCSINTLGSQRFGDCTD